MSEIKTRKMTPKGWLHKSNTKAANSAAGFLSATREFLITGELAPVVSPIIAKLDRGELLPTPAKNLIAHAVMAHVIESDRVKAEAAIERAQEPAAVKPWVAQVLDAAGNICTRINSEGETEELIKSFDHASDADRWSDRRLFEGASDWYAEVEGCGTFVRIERDEAIARILKKAKGPVIHRKGTSTKTLGFGVHCKQTRMTFSRG